MDSSPAPGSPMVDSPICDSDEEVFCGPVTDKELRKASKLKRRTQLYFPKFNWKSRYWFVMLILNHCPFNFSIPSSYAFAFTLLQLFVLIFFFFFPYPAHLFQCLNLILLVARKVGCVTLEKCIDFYDNLFIH